MLVEFSAKTRLFCLLGDPVSHSVSPKMMNAAFSIAGIDAVYLAFRVPTKELGGVVCTLKTIGIGGANVTAPLKEAIAKFLDGLSPTAERAGSVNTIVAEGDRFIGHNTDGAGLVGALTKELGVSLSDTRVLLFGAGGAARGVIPALLDEGIGYLRIVNRDVERAENLISGYKKIKGRDGFSGIEAAPLDPKEINKALKEGEGGGYDIVINSTGVAAGWKANRSDFLGIDFCLLREGSVFFDMNYGGANHDGVELKEFFKSRGILYSDGIPMLLYQGAQGFSLWTNEHPPISAMKSALDLPNK